MGKILSIGKKKRGQSIVEWAIILPFLLLVLFSIIELAPLMNTFIKIEKAAQYGARTGAIHGTSNDKIAQNVAFNLQGLVEEKDLTFKGSSGNQDGILYSASGNGIEQTIVEIVPGSSTKRINGSWIMVRVTYRYPLYTPIIKTLFKSSDVMFDANHFDITRYAIYRIE